MEITVKQLLSRLERPENADQIKHNMSRVSIGVVGLNTQALSFYEKLGFKKEGIQEQGYFHNGSFSDFVMMRMLKIEFNGKT